MAETNAESAFDSPDVVQQPDVQNSTPKPPTWFRYQFDRVKRNLHTAIAAIGLSTGALACDDHIRQEPIDEQVDMYTGNADSNPEIDAFEVDSSEDTYQADTRPDPEPFCDVNDYRGVGTCRDGCIPIGARCADGSVIEFDVCDIDGEGTPWNGSLDGLCPDGCHYEYNLCQTAPCDDDLDSLQFCNDDPDLIAVHECEDGSLTASLCDYNGYDICKDGCYPSIVCKLKD